MKSILSKAVILPVILGLLFSCNSAQDVYIKAKEGEKFSIELPSNRSTGFSWHYIPSGKSLVDSVHVSYTMPQKNAVGGQGIEIWEFMAKEKGQESLLFEYKRGWENVAPAKTKTIRIQID